MENNIFTAMDGRGLRVAVVQARFNRQITDGLANGAMEALEQCKVTAAEKFLVPGAFEIPLMCQKLAQTKKFDGIIALGAVVRGETPHFDYVSKAVTDGILRAMLDSGVPIAFGVLTVNNLAQAAARAKAGEGNKGGETALALVETIIEIKKLGN